MYIFCIHSIKLLIDIEEAKLIYEAIPEREEDLIGFEAITKEEKAIVTKSILVNTCPFLEPDQDFILKEVVKGRFEHIKAVKRYHSIINADIAAKQDNKRLHFALNK